MESQANYPLMQARSDAVALKHNIFATTLPPKTEQLHCRTGCSLLLLLRLQQQCVDKQAAAL
jgi:hypothetical protein